MMQVRAWVGRAELEWAATRERLAPKELVVLAKHWAVFVGVSSGRVGPKIKRCIDPHALNPWRSARFGGHSG